MVITSLWIQATITMICFVGASWALISLKDKQYFAFNMMKFALSVIVLMAILNMILLIGRFETAYNYAFDLSIGRY